MSNDYERLASTEIGTGFISLDKYPPFVGKFLYRVVEDGGQRCTVLIETNCYDDAVDAYNAAIRCALTPGARQTGTTDVEDSSSIDLGRLVTMTGLDANVAVLRLEIEGVRGGLEDHTKAIAERFARHDESFRSLKKDATLGWWAMALGFAFIAVIGVAFAVAGFEARRERKAMISVINDLERIQNDLVKRTPPVSTVKTESDN